MHVKVYGSPTEQQKTAPELIYIVVKPLYSPAEETDIQSTLSKNPMADTANPIGISNPSSLVTFYSTRFKKKNRNHARSGRSTSKSQFALLVSLANHAGPRKREARLPSPQANQHAS